MGTRINSINGNYGQQMAMQPPMPQVQQGQPMQQPMLPHAMQRPQQLAAGLQRMNGQQPMMGIQPMMGGVR